MVRSHRKDFSKCLRSCKEFGWIADLLKNLADMTCWRFVRPLVSFIIITDLSIVQSRTIHLPTLMVWVGDSVSVAWRSSPTVASVRVDIQSWKWASSIVTPFREKGINSCCKAWKSTRAWTRYQFRVSLEPCGPFLLMHPSCSPSS